MTLSAFLLIITGVLLNAVAQLALKASVNDMGAISVSFNTAIPVFTRLAIEPWLWVGLICYGISVIVWILALSRVDVSIAYPMLSIGYIVNAVAAWSLFGEVMNTQRVLGIGIIIVGVIVLTRP
jgi:multidrug transporter EmrE-like cation transporter